jgi:glyoxylase-like metal-dependent hydrolase (beta-lactamase superfamily II)
MNAMKTMAKGRPCALLFFIALFPVIFQSCAPPKPAPTDRFERDADLEALKKATTWPNRTPATLTTLMATYTALGRARDGEAFFSSLAAAEPESGMLLAASAILKIQMSDEIELLNREAWVRGAIKTLDASVALDRNLPRFLRGLALSRVPALFGESARAIEDLTWFLESRDSFLFRGVLTSINAQALVRQARQGLALALETAGDMEKARTEWERAGGQARAGEPLLGTPYSVDGINGFRFSSPLLWKAAPQIHVARGYDFGDINFIETTAGIIVIDSGTTVATAAAALAAYRAQVSKAPIHTVILTHAHWDHIGGLTAFLADKPRVIAQAGFAKELARVNASGRDYKWFFGTQLSNRSLDEPLFSVTPTNLVSEITTVAIGEVTLRLHPAFGGETDDALLVEVPSLGVVFVGDAFMPYLGSPFVGEGSPEGLLQTIDVLMSLKPTLLLHGHAPLTDLFTAANLMPIRTAMGEVRNAVFRGVLQGRTAAQIVHETTLPEILADYPDAVQPVYVMRGAFIQRLHRERTGYWQANLEGLEPIEDSSWAMALDKLAGGDPTRWKGTLETLLAQGDFALAWQLGERAVLAHPDNSELNALRLRAIHGLRARHQLTNPFKLIVLSERADSTIAPIP